MRGGQGQREASQESHSYSPVWRVRNLCVCGVCVCVCVCGGGGGGVGRLVTKVEHILPSTI